MNPQIQIIESKIKELKNLLTNWTNQIATYQSQLEEIINKVNKIKKNMNTKSIVSKTLNKNIKK